MLEVIRSVLIQVFFPGAQGAQSTREVAVVPPPVDQDESDPWCHRLVILPTKRIPQLDDEPDENSHIRTFYYGDEKGPRGETDSLWFSSSVSSNGGSFVYYEEGGRRDLIWNGWDTQPVRVTGEMKLMSRGRELIWIKPGPNGTFFALVKKDLSHVAVTGRTDLTWQATFNKLKQQGLLY